MKNIIILSPSKEMDWTKGEKNIDLDKTSLKIINEIKKFSKKELADFFKIDSELAQKVFNAYKEIDKSTVKNAIDTYNGLAFRQFDSEVRQSDFTKNHLIILSALYGPIGPLNKINPYRLDFSKNLKIEDTNLKKIQKENFNDKLKGCRIYNLASKEFSSLLDKKKMGDWVEIEFYDDFENNKKTHSATSKKLRGQLANYILKNESFDEETFKNFKFEGYKFSDKSKENYYIYENKI